MCVGCEFHSPRTGSSSAGNTSACMVFLFTMFVSILRLLLLPKRPIYQRSKEECFVLYFRRVIVLDYFTSGSFFFCTEVVVVVATTTNCGDQFLPSAFYLGTYKV